MFKLRTTDRLESLAGWAADFASGPWGTHAGFGLLAFWLGAAVVVGWSEAYQYVDEVVTMSSFLLLFLLQRAQAKDTLAMQVKLNELLASVNKASDTLINLEDRPEGEVQQIHDMYEKLHEGNADRSSIDELAGATEAQGPR
ncbi:low affinity iron permease family protein [Singulisphaera sp. PoT]|uniref:low affinity iron permease family protein n=1 Tax=Singulisphaera sp. PoT TaxID=3411797 RepID=UPI003BF60EA8